MHLDRKWVAGFVDGDGCFKVYTEKNGNRRFVFSVSQHKRSVNVLHSLKKVFRCGGVHSAGAKGDNMEFKTTNKQDLLKYIIPFFLENHLQTVKSLDFILFYEELTGKKYQTTVPVVEPLSEEWLLGFTDAEGCFYIGQKHQVGRSVSPMIRFSIGLHVRDSVILEKIKTYLGIGRIREVNRQGKVDHLSYEVADQSGVQKIIQLGFTKGNNCKLKTSKKFDLMGFRDVENIILSGNHLTPESIAKVIEIKEKSKAKAKKGLL